MDSMSKINISDFGPKNIHTELKFNETSDGYNAFWIRVSDKVGNPVIYIDGSNHPITPAYDRENDLISFNITPGFTAFPGEINFELHDILLQKKSDTLTIVVKPAPYGSDDLEIIRTELAELASIKSKSLSYYGLGLSTAHALPWKDDPNIADHLSEIHREIEENFEFSFSDTLTNGKLDGFFWRSSIIYYLSNLLINNIRPDKFKFVECGVGDGITAYIVMSLLDAKTKSSQKWHSYLCDLWKDTGGEKSGLEKNLEGVFDSLSMDRTKRNLSNFTASSTFVHGELPGSIEHLDQEFSDISFIHIDLNFSYPTIKCVEKLYPKLLPGGAILFDDYGWSPHPQTREALKEFIQNNGTFIMFPSGQAVLFKN